MAAEVGADLDNKPYEETKEGGDETSEEAAADGAAHLAAMEAAAGTGIAGGAVGLGLPPQAKPFRALLVDFSLAGDDAQCVFALRLVEQHLLGLDRAQVYRTTPTATFSTQKLCSTARRHTLPPRTEVRSYALLPKQSRLQPRTPRTVRHSCVLTFCRSLCGSLRAPLRVFPRLSPSACDSASSP
jgi:hypothetical protein